MGYIRHVLGRVRPPRPLGKRMLCSLFPSRGGRFTQLRCFGLREVAVALSAVVREVMATVSATVRHWPPLNVPTLTNALGPFPELVHQQCAVWNRCSRSAAIVNLDAPLALV